MITTAISITMHLMLSSYRGVRAVARVLGYAHVLPYSSMALQGKVDFNTKHLKKGDPLPPFTGKLRIYNMRFCPYAHRTILVLNAKNIDYEVVNIDLVDKPEWLTAKSPFGKVPSIEIQDGVTICESTITSEYLDEVYPQRPLLPKEPLRKASDKIIVETIGALIQPLFFKLMKAPDKITQENVTAYHRGLSFIQEHLKSRGTTFLGGEEPGYADYMIWPWFERLTCIDDERTNITSSKYALLATYIQNMRKDPAVSVYEVPKHIFENFRESYATGKPDYEILNK